MLARLTAQGEPSENPGGDKKQQEVGGKVEVVVWGSERLHRQNSRSGDGERGEERKEEGK